jgi:hypothetical protein
MIWISSNSFIWSIWIGQHLRDRRYLAEQLGVRIHQAVAHRGPMIVALVALADARRLLVVTCHNAGSSAAIFGLSADHAARLCDLRDARLQTALIFVGPRIADVLVAVRLREE